MKFASPDTTERARAPTLRLRIAAAISASLLATLPAAALAGDTTAVTPYRPSVSTAAQLPAPGQLEMELGVLSARGDGRRDSLPTQFKLAFDDKWGVLVGADAQVWQRDEGGARAGGFGDTSLVLKRAFVVDEATAWGLELGAKAPTAGSVIGSGRADWTVNGIYSRDIGLLHMDLNLNGTRLGAPDVGAARLRAGAAASFSHPLDERWTAMWEVSGTREGGAPSTGQLLAALSYAPTPRLVVDAGLARGLNPASPRWSFFSGFVVPVAKLW